MRVHDFEQLDEKQQVRILRLYGVYLSDRTVDGNRIYLYAISSFYIELFHELQDTSKEGIRLFKVFDDSRYLEPYLDEVDISSLYPVI